MYSSYYFIICIFKIFNIYTLLICIYSNKIYYNENNPFPIYTAGKDENLYQNIFIFLKNGINNGKRCWPDYIERIKDSKIKSNKKLSFYRKIGFFKQDNKDKFSNNNNINSNKFDTNDNTTNNNDNTEIYTNDKNEKYIIENDKLKIIKKEKINTYEKKIIYKKYVIPFNSINNHDKLDHPGRDSTIFNIKRDNFYWINMKKDVENYIRLCIICNKYKNNQKNEKNKCVTILSKGPKDRYVVDLWYLPIELMGQTNYHYI